MFSARSLVISASLLILTAGVPAAAHHHKAGHATYTIAPAQLDGATQCRSGSRVGGFDVVDGSGVGEPVLLLHGAGVDRDENWSWNYWRALPAAGLEVCWLQSPLTGYVDMQTTAEYVAWAIERMAKASGEDVDLLGHSQGGLIPRWSLTFFPGAKHVDDLITLNSPHHGSVVFDAETAPGSDFPAAWQMRPSSEFLGRLNRDDETPGRTDYTSIYTATDELVQPVGTQVLAGATNLMVQDVCPMRPVEHLGIVADGTVYVLVMDGLLRPGPAQVERSGVTCLETVTPELTPPPGLQNHETPMVTEEPELRPYAHR